jgi:hypothetical protein
LDIGRRYGGLGRGIEISKGLDGNLKAWAVRKWDKRRHSLKRDYDSGVIPWERNCSILTIVTIIQIYDTTSSCSKRLVLLVFIAV